MNKSILEKLFIVFTNIFLPSKQFHESLQLTAKLTPFSHQFCIHFIAFLLQSLSFSFTTEFLDFFTDPLEGRWRNKREKFTDKIFFQ